VYFVGFDFCGSSECSGHIKLNTHKWFLLSVHRLCHSIDLLRQCNVTEISTWHDACTLMRDNGDNLHVCTNSKSNSRIFRELEAQKAVPYLFIYLICGYLSMLSVARTVGWPMNNALHRTWIGAAVAYFKIDRVWNVMAHAQKPDFVFRPNGRVHLNRRGRQFSRLLAAKACASAVVMLDTPRSEVVWEYWLPTPFASFPFTSPPVRHRVPSGFKRNLPRRCSFEGSEKNH
jgi:hypothetical protein